MMKRLIDANVLLELVQFRSPIDNQNAEVIAGCVDITRRLIENAPTVDAVEVVHGRWRVIEGEMTVGLDKFGSEVRRTYRYAYCDKCRKKNVVQSNYCPNCGAKMDGGNEDGM